MTAQHERTTEVDRAQTWHNFSDSFECAIFNKNKLMQPLDQSCDRKLEIDPCIQGSKL